MKNDLEQPETLSTTGSLSLSKGPTRNGILDFFKYISAIAVILVHAPLPGIPGAFANAVGVSGVGFFYLITGYALWGIDKELMCRKIRKRLLRNGIITIITVAVYFIFAWVYASRNHMLYPLKMNLRRPVTYVRMLLLGDFEFINGSALWFMIALLYCYVIFYVIVRFELKKLVYIMTIPLLVLRIVVDTYVNSYPVSWHLSGNLLVGALPMVCLGYVIADQQERLKRIPNRALILCSVLGALAMFATVLFTVGRLNISQPFKILWFTAIFIYGINNPDRHICKPIETCGRQDTLLIYLVHFLFLILIYDYLHAMPHPVKHFDWVFPLTVVAVTLIFSRLVSIVISNFIHLYYYKSHHRGPLA